MKRALSLILSVIILTSSLLLVGNAAEERTGITLPRIQTANTSHPEAFYVTAKRFEELPMTYEAWVYVPKSVHSSRCGIILGNYNNAANDVCVSFEIYKKGVPRIVFCAQDGTEHPFEFNSAAVPADKWTHVAIVYGTGTQNKQVYCYINGELKEKSAVQVFHTPDESFKDNQICLASDYRTLNTQGFRGTLGDVVIYSDVRTPEEIKNDFNNTPDLSDDALMMYYDLSNAEPASDIPDKSGNGYDMVYSRFWLTEEEMEEVRKGYEYEYTYTLAFLPDIQYMTQKYPANLKKLFNYLVEKGKTKNVQYVIGLGDITNANGHKEWSTAIQQTNRLNGYLPYSLVPGNHDVIHNNRLELFNNAYAKKTGYYYQHVDTNGGFMDPDSVRNTYLCFSVGEIDYIIINLDFGATDNILEWAGGVLTEHSDRRAIIVTHGYTSADGTTLDAVDPATPPSYDSAFNSGEDMWNKLIRKYENIDMVVSGHINHSDVAYTVRQGDAGNDVYQILMDPQTTCNTLGGMGVIGFMYFTEDGNHAQVEYYSTVFEKYFCESNKMVKLTFGTDEPEETTAPETEAPATNAPVESTDTEEVAKSGCGATLTASSTIIAFILLPTIFKKKRFEIN